MRGTQQCEERRFLLIGAMTRARSMTVHCESASVCKTQFKELTGHRLNFGREFVPFVSATKQLNLTQNWSSDNNNLTGQTSRRCDGTAAHECSIGAKVLMNGTPSQYNELTHSFFILRLL